MGSERGDQFRSRELGSVGEAVDAFGEDVGLLLCRIVKKISFSASSWRGKTSMLAPCFTVPEGYHALVQRGGKDEDFGGVSATWPAGLHWGMPWLRQRTAEHSRATPVDECKGQRRPQLTMLFKVSLVGVLTTLTVSQVWSQSCVQLSDTTLVSVPCADASLTFTLEGVTTVAENTVNLAIIVDGSGSINEVEFLQEQNFTQEIVAAFAASNLFANGGNASYVQYATDLVSSGTFSSAEAYNDFVNNDVQARGGTNTASGIDEGIALLGVSNTTASFMIVITDGGSNTGGPPEVSADQARAEGITVLAVGVGNGVNDEELLGIGGNESNVFNVADFDALNDALSDVIESSGGSTIMCPSTGVNLTVEFNVTVVAADPGIITGKTVVYNLDDLEANPTSIEVILDTCDSEVGDIVVLSANYTDDQGNDPDLSALLAVVVGPEFTPSPTVTLPPSPPTTVTPTTMLPTPSPSSMPTPSPMDTPSPSSMPTPSPISSDGPTPTPVDMPSMAPTAVPTAYNTPVSTVGGGRWGRRL